MNDVLTELIDTASDIYKACRSKNELLQAIEDVANDAYLYVWKFMRPDEAAEVQEMLYGISEELYNSIENIKYIMEEY